MFVYKHTETIEYVKKVNFLRKIQTSRLNSSRILRIKNVKFPGYSFFINPQHLVKFPDLLLIVTEQVETAFS